MAGSEISSTYRLPATVVPRRYDLELRPDLDAATFSGQVTIHVELSEPTDSITLHALDLDIDRVDVVSRSGHTWGIDAEPTVEHHPEAEVIRLLLPGELPAGEADIHAEFRGVLNDQLVGFYRSTFTTDGTDAEHALAVTQFESTHARRAFPCFDEPAFKAVFSVTLVVAEDLFAVSNGAVSERTSIGDGLDRVRFAPTIAMSTYLVAFVVGPLEATPVRQVPGRNGPIALRVVHPPGAGHLCEFSLDVAEAALQFFERYYELPYPGDKLDLVAVPDFAFGAMENLGCVTFREVLLLIDPGAATQPELQRVADVINHELAHMWFGDLVTMSWWNGIWLNEAFATFMEVTATDSFRPDWDVWTTFGLARSAAFDTDALESTRPIEYEVVTAADAEGMFDILTYEKGASVVRMLEQYLGAEPFRRGIAVYLHRHAYGNTETTDLWDALEEATGEPVRRIMDNWIFRGGHPLVSIEATGDGLRLHQTRFRYAGAPTALSDSTAPDSSGSDSSAPGDPWPVPMVIRTCDPTSADDAEIEHRILLEADLDLDLGGVPALVRPNVGGNGFYRVALDADLRRRVAERPSDNPLERFVLLDDTWAAFVADRIPSLEVIELLRTITTTETDPSVWKWVAGRLRRLVHLAGPDHREQTSGLVVACARPALDSFGGLFGGPPRVETAATAGHAAVAADDARRHELRGLLVSVLGTAGAYQPIRSVARPLLTDSAIDAPLRAAAIEVVAASADHAEHRELERRWRHAATPQDELRYLHALVDTPDLDDFDRALTLTATEVRTQNAPYLLRRALTHPDFGDHAWAFIAANWSQLVDRFPSNSLSRMLEGVRDLAERPVAEAVAEFLADHPIPSGQRQVDQHLERMWVSVAAAERVRADLAASHR